jgi:surfactin synthase thioesterase subunit
MNLICFPYAGGGKTSYRKYLKYKDPKIDLVTIEYPGRGTRQGEPLLLIIDDMVNDAYNQIVKLLDKPYAFYGHSMGALIGYLVMKRISLDKNKNLPRSLFVSGRQGPSVHSNENLNELNREHLIKKLSDLGGSENSILYDQDLMNLYEPIIRADFKVIASYQYDFSGLIEIPITVIIGNEDSIKEDEAHAWQDETSVDIEIKKYPGNHFFIFDNSFQIMSLINTKLK